uniref:Plastocyanin-like domain-containing protein n=1 Tax=Vitis vinifera TaxID=29760 RepID=F6GYA8_VITVI
MSYIFPTIYHIVRTFPCFVCTLSHSVREASYKRLCSTKNILTVNGKFPGPTIYATKGETIIVDVYNKGNENITIHW